MVKKVEKIDLFKVPMHPSAAEAASKVLLSSYVGQGPRVEEFEARLQEVLGLPRRPLTTNSCTSAIELALHLCGVKHDSVVIATPMACSASSAAIVSRQAWIIWADIDKQTGLIDSDSIERAVSHAVYVRKEVKAILAVDWAGRLCDYKRLREHGIPIIQDAAHSFLANGEGGDYRSFSFQAIKSFSTVDGGALHVPDHQHHLAKLLRWYGLDRESSADFRCSQLPKLSGWKWHMNDLNAAIGLANLEYAKECVAHQRENAAFYDQALRGLKKAQLPPADPNSSWWLYCLLVDNLSSFKSHMAARGIATSPVHSRNDRMPCFRRACLTPDIQLPGVDHFASREVAIPVGWWLSESDCNRVVDAVKEWDAL